MLLEDDLLAALIPNIRPKITEEITTPAIVGLLDHTEAPAKFLGALFLGKLLSLGSQVTGLLPGPLPFRHGEAGFFKNILAELEHGGVNRIGQEENAPFPGDVPIQFGQPAAVGLAHFFEQVIERSQPPGIHQLERLTRAHKHRIGQGP